MGGHRRSPEDEVARSSSSVSVGADAARTMVGSSLADRDLGAENGTAMRAENGTAMRDPRCESKTSVVAIDMGYGHLRAAEPLAEVFKTGVAHADLPPIGGSADHQLWLRVRQFHEHASKLSQLPFVGSPMRRVLDGVTSIPPLYPYRDLSSPTIGVELLARFVQRGLGEGLIEHLKASGDALVTTFYAPAIVADHGRCERVYCVVTDTDINRIWVARNPGASRIRYFVPSLRAARRLRSYGVPADRIEYTGFPLPTDLVGGTALMALRRNLAARLVRLDPRGTFRDQARHDLDHFLGPLPTTDEHKPPLLTFAVGGAGAQTQIARHFLRGFRRPVSAGAVRIALVAGVRAAVAEQFCEWVRDAGLGSELGNGIQVLIESDWTSYYRAFNRLLAETDMLWTKPSEMVFYAALGIPEILSWPVGVHERYNRRWVLESGAGFKQGNPRFAAQWIHDWLQDGTLAGAAWSGFLRLPKFGTHRIHDVVCGAPGDARRPGILESQPWSGGAKR